MVAGTGFTISSWQDIALVLGLMTALAGVLGSLATSAYTRRKSSIESQAAEVAASDRIIRLIEQEAEKRVEVVRTEFQLKIAEMQLAHKNEIEDMRNQFERELDELRSAQALVCTVDGCAGRIVSSARRK